MAWDGSGNFVRNTGVFTGPTAWQQTRDANRQIRADDADTHDQDIALGLENTLTRDGQTAPTSDLPMAGRKHTNVADSAALNQYPSGTQVQNFVFSWCGLAGGTANAIALSPGFAISSYVAGQVFFFTVATTNSGPVTVNVSNQGARPLKRADGQDLEDGDLVNQSVATILYDGSSFILQSAIAKPVAFTDTANVFSADQTIQSTDSGAGTAPLQIIDRDSSSPAVGDNLGETVFRGRSSTAASVDYGGVRGEIVSPTNAAPNGEVVIETAKDGIKAPAVHIGKGIYTPNATGGDQGIDTINVSQVYANGELLEGGLKEEGPIPCNSGTEVNVTGLTGAKYIELWFREVSGSTTAQIEVTIGDSGGIEITGYFGSGSRGTQGYTFNGNAWRVTNSNAANAEWNGVLIARRFSSADNMWTMSSQMARNVSDFTVIATGNKALSGALDRLRVDLSTSGNFNQNGEINVFWR